MDRKLIRISKFLSLVLRHRPETIGLSLDKQGWAKVDELLAAANRAGVSLDKALLQKVVAQSDKQRFTVSENGLRIRACYGHSISANLGLEPLIPPEFLFHGTATRFLGSIKKHGLVRRKRNYVHLSPNEQTAIMVGQRHGKPFVLTIQAGVMHEKGWQFYCQGSGIWLTEKVPPEYIIFPESYSKVPRSNPELSPFFKGQRSKRSKVVWRWLVDLVAS